MTAAKTSSPYSESGLSADLNQIDRRPMSSIFSPSWVDAINLFGMPTIIRR